MLTKNIYEIPTTDFISIRVEQGILALSDPNAVQSNSASSGYDNENDLGDII